MLSFFTELDLSLPLFVLCAVWIQSYPFIVEMLQKINNQVFNAYLKRFAKLKKGLHGLIFKLNNLIIFKYALGRQKKLKIKLLIN